MRSNLAMGQTNGSTARFAEEPEALLLHGFGIAESSFSVIH